MLRRLEPSSTAPSPRMVRALWGLAVLDAAAVAWMLAMGEWLDTASPLTAVLTLGGHHVLVLWLAVAGLAALAGAAALWLGEVGPTDTAARVLAAVAGGVSVPALSGTFSIALLLAGVVWLLGVLGRAFVR